MDAKSMIVGTLLIVLFGIAFISFGVQFGSDMDAPINIQNDSTLGELHNTLGEKVEDYDDGKGIQEIAEDTSSAYEEEDTAGEGVISEFIVSTILGVGNTIMSVANIGLNIFIEPLLKIVFPQSQEVRRVVGGILASIIMFILALVAWKLIKTGY